jgi:hypothetical protein
MAVATTENEQVVEAVVSGPDGATRLLTCTGQAVLAMVVGSNQNRQETWTFLVGPPLPHPQFHRAIASVSVADYGISLQQAFDPVTGQVQPINATHSLNFQSVDADWDDDSGRTEMQVQVAIATGTLQFTLSRIGYTATVLAESA